MKNDILLAVDDRPQNLFILSELVAEYLPDCHLLTAVSAEEGLAIAAERDVDGVIVDVQMPLIDGLEMCRRLKTDEKTAHIPVVLITAHKSNPELRAKGLELGADDFITKPIGATELVAKIKVILRIKKAEDQLRHINANVENLVVEKTKAIKEREEQRRTILQTAMDGFWFLDMQGRILEVNETYCRMSGYSERELLTMRVPDLEVVETSDDTAAHIQKVVAQGEDRFETRHRSKDGSIFDVEVSVQYRDNDGGQFIAFLRDITTRKRAENALRENEARYRSLFENLLEGCAYCRMLFEGGRPQDFIYLAVNNAFERLTGLKEVVGKKVTEVMPYIKEMNPELFEIYGRVALTGEPERFGIYFKSLESWLSISVYSPEKEYFVTVFDNITESKLAEYTLRRSEERFRQVAEITGEWIWEVDRNGVYRYSNSAVKKILGYSPDELVNQKHFYDLFVPETREQQRESALAVFERKDSFQKLVNYNVHKNGEIVILETSGTPLLDGNGNLLGYRGTDTDITERKQYEEERETTLHLLQLLNSGNDKRALIQLLTDFLQLWSGCQAVGIRLREGEDYPYYETSGFPPEFVLAENRLCVVNEKQELVRDSQGNPILECMCGNILCGRFNPCLPFFTENGSFWTNCTTDLLAATTEADRQTRTRNRCNGEGYESVALIPLCFGGTTFGILQFNDRRKGRFTPELIAFLERTANSIATALEQRITHEKLKESEECYQQLFDHLGDGVAVYKAVEEGRDFVFVDINQPGQSLSNITLEEAVGKRITEIFPSVESIGLLHVFQRVWQTGQPESHPLTFYKDARIEQWIENYVYKIPSGLIVAIYSDTTTQRKAEEALRNSETLYHSLVENIPQFMFRKDLEGRFTFANQGFCKNVGKPFSEIVGKTDFDFYPRSLAEKYGADDRSVMETGKPFENEEENQTLKGEKTYVQVIKTPVRDAEGKIIGVQGIFWDITEQRRLEEQLRQAQKVESIGRLVGGVAHEFNNLVMGVNGFCTLALNQLSSSNPVYQDIEEIKKSGSRMGEITRQLLAFGRKQRMRLEVLNLNLICSNFMNMLRSLIGEDIRIVTKFDPNLWNVKVDEMQIHQVLMNLAINARDAMPNGGILTLETGNEDMEGNLNREIVDVLPGPYVRLKVSDTGCGMNEEIQALIFEPFFTTKDVGQGTGMGLSTVHGIISQCNGYINVTSQPGKGTTFCIYLPRVQKAVERIKPSVTVKDISGGTETILLVEDHKIVLEVTSRRFRSAGYTVLEARNGLEALQLVKRYEKPIHILVTDIVMPSLGGFELAQKLAPMHPEMKIVYMSGYPKEKFLDGNIILDPVVNYIEKPISLDMLVQRIRSVLDAS